MRGNVLPFRPSRCTRSPSLPQAGEDVAGDLLDLRVALLAPDDVRLARLAAREGAIGPWERQWHEAEDFYFKSVMPPDAFDVAINLTP